MPRVPESFYEPDGDHYVATELTRGPWDPGAQHAGPPAALIGREIERLGGGRMGGGDGPPAQVARVTYEILRMVPIGRLRVEAEVVRPGRRVELVQATLSDDRGEPLVRARGWRLRTEPVSFEAPQHRDAVPPGLDQAEPGSFLDTGYDVGYHSAMEYRFVRGGFTELGAADTGNGVSVTLDWSRYLFINVDLTVHLHRMPTGEWVCLDAETFPEASGVGTADTQLLDESGQIGRAVQTLLVAER
jgi:hypothetical protein